MSVVPVVLKRSLASPWRLPLAACLFLVLALVVLYWDTLTTMVGIWDRSGTFAHCFLVAPISAWLVWRLRDELKALTPKPQPWLLVPMAVVGFAWLVGDMASVNALTEFAFTAQLVLAVPLVLGTAVARRIAFPLAFLFFMVPFGEFLLPWLMQWTADFTIAALRLSGIPVYREGLQFVIPSGNWSVVEACSGVRYLIASFMVGSLFAYLNYNSLKRRLIFCGVSLAVPLLANWLRAYMIVMLGHYSGNKLAVGVDHLIYGWVFFGVVVGVMFFIGSRWTEAPLAPTPDPHAGTAALATRGALLWAVLAGVAVLLAPHVMNSRMNSQAVSAGATPPLALSPLAGTADASATPSYTPPLQNPTATVLRAYAVNGGTVFVHLGYYQQQTYGRKLVSSVNSLVEGEEKTWQMTGSGTATVDSATGPATWRTATLLGGSVSAGTQQRQRVEVRQTYWAGDRITASSARATLYTVMGKLAGQGDAAAMITVYTEGGESAEAAALVDAFLRTHAATLERQLVTYRSLR
jgi:exosortase A